MIDVSKRRIFAKRVQPESAVTLPWLAKPEHFTDGCTRCGQCIPACETKIITKSSGGFPSVDFSIDGCTFCYQCAEACPEPLFLARSKPPWQAKAQIDNACLAKHNIECRSCGESCEPMAIQFKPELGKVAQPNLNLDECNGCGACVSVCPTSSINVSNVTA